MTEKNSKLDEVARNIRLIVTDMDGVHTSDHVTIFGKQKGDQEASFGIHLHGKVRRFKPCDSEDEIHYLAGTEEGRIEGYRFYTRDGIAVKECKRHGIPVVFMTGRSSPAVIQRSKDLGIELRYGVIDKVAEIEGILASHDVEWNELFFMGNDVQDLALLRRAGFSAAPADAAVEVLNEVMYVSSRNGGDGAVRDALEVILKAKGYWQEIVERARTLG